MTLEADTLVLFSSISTKKIAKIKCYYKTSACMFSCGESNDNNNENIHVQKTTINDVDMLYVTSIGPRWKSKR